MGNAVKVGFPITSPGVVSLKSLEDRVKLRCFPIFPQTNVGLVLGSLSCQYCMQSVVKRGRSSPGAKEQSLSGPEEETEGVFAPTYSALSIAWTVRLATSTTPNPYGAVHRLSKFHQSY